MSQSEVRSRHMSDVHIAFLLTYGFVARMMIRSGVARQLVTQGARVTVISPNADEAYFQQECQIEKISLRREPGSGGRIAHWFRANRSYFLDDVMNNPALKSKHVRQCENRLLFSFAMEMINRRVARWPLFRKFYRAFERLVNRSKSVKGLLDELRPDLLVLSNPFGVEETIYLLHAKELRIPVVCQMLSWDNITSKGTPLMMPDYFISWGPIMTDEMVGLYHFSRERIYECGVPHFDVYRQQDRLTSCDRLLRELHLPLEEPYLFYGMVPEYSCPNEVGILTWLADQVNKSAFAKPCSLVIRPHPQTISGAYSITTEKLEKLKTLVGPRVVLDIPPVLSEQLAWDLPKSDMYRLASLLGSCAMCINANSTLCLDACMLDRPVVNIAFDGWEELPYEKSARRGPNYIHMANLLALGGIRTARSFSELERHINAYLCNPSLDHNGRMLSAARECGPRDGRATQRVATKLLELARLTEKLCTE